MSPIELQLGKTLDQLSDDEIDRLISGIEAHRAQPSRLKASIEEFKDEDEEEMKFVKPKRISKSQQKLNSLLSDL